MKTATLILGALAAWFLFLRKDDGASAPLAGKNAVLKAIGGGGALKGPTSGGGGVSVSSQYETNRPSDESSLSRTLIKPPPRGV